MFFDQDCSTCAYLDSKKGNDKGKFYCERNHYDVPASQNKCDKYCSIMSYKRSTSEANELYRNSRAHGYYVLTALTIILNLDNNNEYLESFKYLKDYVLPQSNEGIEFINKYDEFGPEIADNLYNDESNISYSIYLLDCYIKPMTNYIKNNQYKEAFNIFKNCFNTLQNKYKINKGKRYILTTKKLHN